MHLSLLLTSFAFSRSYAAADPMTVKKPLLTLTEENADALSHSASMDGYTAVYSPMFQLGSGAGSVSGDAVLKRGHLPVSDAVLKSGHSLDVTYLPRPDAEIKIAPRWRRLDRRREGLSRAKHLEQALIS